MAHITKDRSLLRCHFLKKYLCYLFFQSGLVSPIIICIGPHIFLCVIYHNWYKWLIVLLAVSCLPHPFPCDRNISSRVRMLSLHWVLFSLQTASIGWKSIWSRHSMCIDWMKEWIWKWTTSSKFDLKMKSCLKDNVK